MTPVEIYTQPLCGYCTAAMRLLAAKGAAITEHDVSSVPGAREAMARRSGGRRTTPQIFVGDVHVGGCDDLHALERAGRLDALLAG